MRKRLVIEIEANYVDEKAIVDKISYAAMKVLRANKGNLIGIHQEEVPGNRERQSRLFVPSIEMDAEDPYLLVGVTGR